MERFRVDIPDIARYGWIQPKTDLPATPPRYFSFFNAAVAFCLMSAFWKIGGRLRVDSRSR